jgi:SAM-dependent methyltransferase
VTPEQPADPYADLPELYDLEHDAFRDDVDFYLQSVAAVGGPVLELGCGTGRVLSPLAAAGFDVSGLDSSPAMLERARARLASVRTAGTVTLHVAPMQEVATTPGGPFGVIIIALNGLLHLADQHEQRRTLAACRKALDPRGQLIIDVLNPVPGRLAEFDGTVLHEGQWKRPNGSTVDKFSARHHRPAAQAIDATIWYDMVALDGSLRRVPTAFTQRYLHQSELSLLLELAGFASHQVYGSYDLDPYDDDAERILVAAEPT